MQSSRLPIWRDSQLLLVEIEQAVRQFPRYHKYAIGTDLRQQAIRILRVLTRAINAQGKERELYVRQLVDAIDDIKFLITTAKTLQTFASFKQFQRLAELAVALGKQSGAWLRKLARNHSRPEPVN